MEAILSCEGLHKTYQTQAETVRALNGVDLAVRPAEEDECLVGLLADG